MPAVMQQSPGSGPAMRFGRYEVLFKIAAGGMAEVYVARLVGEGGFEKLVALKRMLPTLADDERFVGMFLDEGRVAANISSPHVVSTLDLGRAEDDSLYLVMELVVGVSLSALLRVLGKEKQAFPLDLAVELLAQAAAGLHDAHEARTIYGEPLGIVHRDVSPQNVLVDVAGRVRITDFGVARALERVTQTQSGEVKGKLAYFAPEQARAQPLDRRADVYALGIIAWEVLSGKRLFLGEGPADTLTKVLTMEAPRLDAMRPDVPKALADAVAGALARNLDERTPSAGAFAQALRASMPTPGPSALGALVRERGGESLLRLEAGIRSLTPSSPSGRVTRSGAIRGLATDSGPEEPTTRTPSAVSAVRTASPAAPAAPPAPAAPMPPVELEVTLPPITPDAIAATPFAAPPASAPVAAPVAAAPVAPAAAGNKTMMVVAAIAVVVALLGLGAFAFAGRGAPEVTSTPLTDVPAAPAIAAPASVVPASVVPASVVPASVVPASVVPASVVPASVVPPPPATGTDAPVVEAPEVAAEGDPAGRRRVARPPATTARPPATTAVAAAPPPTSAAPPVRDTAPRRTSSSESRSTGSAAHRPDALRGMDDFEAELNGH